MCNENFNLLVQEGHLTASSLLNGLNSIRKSNIDDSRIGLFYSGLFGLSTGLERLMKIVLILDHKIKNDLKNPTDKELRTFGHDIKKLFGKCSELPQSYGLMTELMINDKQRKILSTITEFSKGSRYYNLDVLANTFKNENPISLWLSVIYDHIWSLRNDVRNRLKSEAIQFVDRWGMARHWHQNADGEFITMLDFYYLLLSTEKANPHIVYSIIEILRPFYELISHQCNSLHNIYDLQSKKNEIPYMCEFFTFFMTPKSVALRKKQWVWGK